MRAYIIVDLGFGDAGKGLVTDFLARRAPSSVVVRYNGGAQAGHNVVDAEGRHHTFSQFGSGTFVQGVKTYLSKYVVVHPGALLLEGQALAGQGVRGAFERIRVSDQALIITPFHQAANHIREIARSENRHGSCGAGVGEAVEDALLDAGLAVRAGDLSRPPKLRRLLGAIREHKRAQLLELHRDLPSRQDLAREWEIFERADVIEAWIASISRMGWLGLVVSDEVLESWLRRAETAIFEGAQGVLLDADAGFHPYTTWSRCTAANAVEILEEMASDAQITQIGVMRCYAVRHGPGPLPTETRVLHPVVTEHNRNNAWQGPVRYGWFDAVLARYALAVTGGIDALAITHLDVLPRLAAWRYGSGYRAAPDLDHFALQTEISGGILEDLRLPAALSLAEREQLTRALSNVSPVLESCDADAEKVVQMIASLTRKPVGMISNGPTAGHVKILNALPCSMIESLNRSP